MNNINSIIQIEYCNNIVKTDITIETGNLNIKYAINGTGKSTIAKALKLTSEKKSLDTLRPFSFQVRNEKKLSPTVSNFHFQNVKVFDNEYLKQYIFQKSDILKDAFEVFIYSPEYDELQKKIEIELLNIKNLARDNPGFVKIKDMLRGLTNILITNKDGQSLSRKSGGTKSIIDEGKGALFSPPDSLRAFKPFFEDSIAVDWAAWKLKGINSFCEKGLCPFCAEKENDEKKLNHQTFKDSFNENSIQFAHKLLNYLTQIKEYLDNEKYNNLLEMLKPGSDRKTLEMLLAKISVESTYLLSRLENLASFNGYSIEENKLNEIEKIFLEMKVSKSILDFFNTELFFKEMELLNAQIDMLVSAIGKLKGQIAKFKRYLQTQIKCKKQDINDFLEAAGYNYRFDILSDGDNVAHAILRYIVDNEETCDVSNPEQNLSWGERNAFALIMFMFDAVSKNADLVILDDPISSFDSNKKYAIMNRLFKSGKNTISFKNKTVLLLTHDFEPVIDYVQVSTSESALASYLFNNDGIINERSIKKNNDMCSMVVLLRDLASDITNQLPVRIGCLRKYIEHTNRNPQDSFAYHILSSLTHGREYPTSDNKGLIKLTLSQYKIGIEEISKFINNFDYDDMLKSMKPNILLTMYVNESNDFFRLLILRAYIECEPGARDRIKAHDEILRKFVDETFHIENDYIYILDVRRFNIVPNFYIKKATFFIESEIKYQSEFHSKLNVIKWQEYFTLIDKTREVHLYDVPASAGDGIELFDGIGSEIVFAIDQECDFAVTIKGNSMEPGIPDGSIAFVKKCNDILNYRIGIFRLSGNVYCKQMVRLTDRISLVSLNEDYETIHVTDEDFYIFGEITGIVMPKIL